MEGRRGKQTRRETERLRDEETERRRVRQKDDFERAEARRET